MTPKAPRNAPAAPRSAQTPFVVPTQPADLIEVIRALRRLEQKRPRDFWLFAANGSFWRMKMKAGKPAATPQGGIDNGCFMGAFLGIEADGGDS